jgi:hypothetical protein
MKKIILLLHISLLTSIVFANCPRIVSDLPVTIDDPFHAQAFYGELHGRPHSFSVSSDSTFHLYLRIMEPDIDWALNDFMFSVCRRIQDTCIKIYASLPHSSWDLYVDDYFNNRYLLGPEFRQYSKQKKMLLKIGQKLPAGDYSIIVSNPKNNGKYVLVVGREERWPRNEVLNTMALYIPMKLFHEEPVYRYFLTLYSIIGLVAFLIVATIVFLVIRRMVQLLP